MDTTTTLDWNRLLVDQADWHWTNQLRPRLDGLTDEEYLWEPVPGSWNVRPRDPDVAEPQPGRGPMTIDFAFPEPEPAPVTTIAWRLAHVVVGVLAMRNASHFGAPAADYGSFEYAGTAQEGLAQLDHHYEVWCGGVRSLGEEGLRRPCGEAEGPYAEAPLALLVLHISREIIHHGAEMCLLRDLYAHRHDERQETGR